MSMVKVECDGCGSPYQIEERRIPATGLKMRCTKCGKSLLVQKPAAEDAQPAAIEEDVADLPAPAPPRVKGGTEPILPRVAPAAADKPADKPTMKLGPARPAAPPAPPKPAAPKPAAAKPAPIVEEDDWGEEDAALAGLEKVDLPAPAKPTVQLRAPAAAAPPAAPPEDMELDLPAPAKPTVQMRAVTPTDALDVDLPAPAKPTVQMRAVTPTDALDVDLPAPAKPAPPKAAPPKPAPPKPTVPAKPAAKKPEEADLPAPAAKPAADKGFGEIDLPSPAGKAAKPAPPKPAPPKPTVPAKPAAKAPEIADLPAPTAKPAGGIAGFGEIDLPSPASSKPTGGIAGFGEIDLPSPASAKPAGTIAGFGEIDLPSSKPAAVAKLSQTDLPVVATPAFGEIDLPASVPPGLPMPASLDGNVFGEIDLPAPEAGAGFGEIDLPAPELGFGPSSFGEVDLPPPPPPTKEAPPRAAKPAPAPPPEDETSFAGLGDFGELDLPLVDNEPAAPPPAPAQAAPRAMAPPPAAPAPAEESFDDAALDAAFDFGPTRDKPAPKSKRGPAPATPPPPRSKPRPAPDAGEEFSFGELNMDLSADAVVPSAPQPQVVPTQVAIQDKPAAAPPPEDASAGIGDEVELAPGSQSVASRRGQAKPGKAEPAKPQATGKPARNKRAVYAVAVFALIAVGGGSLALLPDIGPFGAHAISDRLNAAAYAQALADLKTSARKSLDEDTFVASARALSDARAAMAARPRHRPTTSYAAYVAFARSLRHGKRSDDETLGAQLLALTQDSPGPERALALAAQAATAGKWGDARNGAKDVLDKGADLDAAVLLGEIELASGAPADALAAWKRAAGIQKSARTLYGLARAQRAAGDTKGAEASARAAIEASPRHAGARVLLASLLAADATKETEALDLLAKVTAEGDVRSAASDAQLVDAYIELGRLHLSRSRISAASEAFAAALKIDPRSVAALVGDAELFYRSGRFTQALTRFEEAVKADDRGVLARVGVAKTMLALERMKEARDLLKKLRQDRPQDALVAYWLGRTEDALGDKKESEALFLDAIKTGGNQPEAVDAYVALSALLSSLGRGDEAQAKLAEAQTKFPDLAALHRAKGEVLLSAGRYAEAKQEFEAALAKEDDLGTRFRLGVTLRRMRSFEEAGAVLDKVAEVDKDYPGLALERGLLFEETGQSEKALEMYADALKKAPNDIDLKLRVGSTQVVAGHPEQAEPILREVLKERANSADANHFLGRALLLKGGQAVEAMRFLERAVEIDANRAEYHLYVGWAAIELSNYARAEQALTRALEIDRELADAYWQRGVLLEKQGRAIDALADLQTAIAKRPSRFEVHAAMALCYQDLARWPEATEAWQKAIAGNDGVAEWHYRLGKIYAGNGNRAGSTPELEKAIQVSEAKKQTPVWLFDAYFLYAEAMRGAGQKEKAIHGYKRYLELAPVQNAYRTDAERALQSLGAGATL
jgi:predicted Zn finger-like uncharacterized protein